jgi:transcriptional regulator of NAD metabolism
MFNQAQVVPSADRKITIAGLIARINRKLGHNGERLCAARVGGRLESNVGRHYVLDMTRNVVIDTHVDLETLGRELRVLRPGESLG